MIIDSHCHASLDWYEPVETLLRAMDAVGVDRAVLIQIIGQFDNAYQQDCVSKHPDRLLSVVGVDASRPDASEELERLAERRAAGVRLQCATRSPGDDPLAIWRTAGRLGLTVSCLGTPAEFASEEFLSLARSLPEVRIVAEHLGGLTHLGGFDLHREAARAICQDLADLANVYIKLPGLGQLSERLLPVGKGSPFTSPVGGLIHDVVAAFGADRVMWGSDFPKCCAREGYGAALAYPHQQLADLDRQDRDMVFGEVAARVFSSVRLCGRPGSAAPCGPRAGIKVISGSGYDVLLGAAHRGLTFGRVVVDSPGLGGP